MKVRQRGRGNTSSGVAPQDMIFIPVPASYLPWQDFYFFGRFSLCSCSQSFGAGAPMKILFSKKTKANIITVK